MITLDSLNRLAPHDFVGKLEGIFEHSSWIAQRAVADAPFSSRLQLLQRMRAAVNSASSTEQLALIHAHPKLGARGRTRQQLTQESSREQKTAGLDACSDEEFALLQRMNAAYEEKFGFPFILAVRGHDPPSIIAQMQRRLQHDREQEKHSALHEIGLIAGYRLADVIASDAAVEVSAMLHLFEQARPASQIMEWMRTANLTVRPVQAGGLIGLRSGASRDTGTLILGLHYNADSRSLIDDGPLGCMIGIAVSQQIREHGRQLPFDLAVVSRPQDDAEPRDWSQALHAPRGCIGMQSVDVSRAQSGVILSALRAAGCSNSYFLICDAVGDEAGQVTLPPPAQIVHAVSALQQFLLHTHPVTDQKGQSLNHG